MNCWICCKLVDDFLLLPYEDDYLDENIGIFKNSFIIKNCKPFKFLYFTCCNDCIEKYINYKYNNKKSFFKRLIQRQLYGY